MKGLRNHITTAILKKRTALKCYEHLMNDCPLHKHGRNYKCKDEHITKMFYKDDWKCLEGHIDSSNCGLPALEHIYSNWKQISEELIGNIIVFDCVNNDYKEILATEEDNEWIDDEDLMTKKLSELPLFTTLFIFISGGKTNTFWLIRNLGKGDLDIVTCTSCGKIHIAETTYYDADVFDRENTSYRNENLTENAREKYREMNNGEAPHNIVCTINTKIFAMYKMYARAKSYGYEWRNGTNYRPKNCISPIKNDTGLTLYYYES